MTNVSLYIAGEWIETNDRISVYNKYTGEEIGHVSQATEEHIHRAVRTAKQAMKLEPLSEERRYQILSSTSVALSKQQDEIAALIAKEAGKPFKEAKGEVARAARTFLIAAEESKRIVGEMIPIASAVSNAKLAFTLRAPIGVVCAISPFNFPINLVAHKIAPAIAAGNAFVLKPATVTPLTSIRLLQIMIESGLPRGYGNLVIGSGSTVGEWLLKESGFSFYTFTGSPSVGQHLKKSIGLRPCTLELGSNSATIVHSDADLSYAAERCARTAFNNAGQVCISVQRIFVHEDVKSEFIKNLVQSTKGLTVGDPTDSETDVGPMISEAEAVRAQNWIEEAVQHGGTVVCGGTRIGSVVHPTVLVDVPLDTNICVEEAFAPVVVVTSYREIEEAIELVNSSRYGLQAGLFTNAMDIIVKCAREIEVGGLMVNETSSYRSDEMPYGGVKESGIGREGPRFAIAEMTEMRLVVIHK